MQLSGRFVPLLLASLAIGLVACDDKETGDTLKKGAEKTGEAVGSAAEKTGEVVGDALDKASRTRVHVDVPDDKKTETTKTTVIKEETTTTTQPAR